MSVKSDEKRSSRRIKNRLLAYIKPVKENEIDRIREEIYYTVDPSDSIKFFMALEKLDASFGDLNKAFVLMMQQMDAKLNYIIDLLKDKERAKQMEEFTKVYTCDLSQNGISFVTNVRLAENGLVYMRLSLPIALHYEIKCLARITHTKEHPDGICYGCTFEEIKKEDTELIIHYMIFFERKMIKNRQR